MKCDFLKQQLINLNFLKEFSSLAHVSAAPRYQHQGPARRPHARPLRPRAGQQAPLQSRSKGPIP